MNCDGCSTAKSPGFIPQRHFDVSNGCSGPSLANVKLLKLVKLQLPHQKLATQLYATTRAMDRDTVGETWRAIPGTEA